MLVAIASGIALLKIPAPFGRFSNKKWGIRVDNRIGWFIMEFPALFVFPFILFSAPNQTWMSYFVPICAVSCWTIHYFHRTLIYPFRIRSTKKAMPIAVMSIALFCNCANGIFLGYYYAYLYRYSALLPIDVARIAIGIGLFIVGMYINITHDTILINLRDESETQSGYKIPAGALFERSSCPNLLGEIIEWTGFLVISWSLPALSMALWTCANLIPRSISVHKWYQSTFKEYPLQRGALIPCRKSKLVSLAKN